MAIDQPLLALVGAADTGAYEINQSLRFNSADSAYLSRTPSSAGNRRTFTWSGWVKRSYLGSAGRNLWSAYPDSATNAEQFRFGGSTGNDNLWFLLSDADQASVQTSALYRDAAAWLHVVVAVDTTQATASNRVKLYVNGSQITDLATASYPSQNYQSVYNSTVLHTVGANARVSDYFDGYLAEVNFIDGTALTPSSFGETDTITGAWIPKKYSGSYGTNGFYLKFDPSATNGIGHDHSGNGNNFTATGFSTSGTGTDVMSDTPTNNWCTLNPLDKKASFSYLLEDGNLVHNMNSGGDGNFTTSAGSISVSTGKWYWEVTMEYFAALGILNSAVSLETNGGIFWNDSAGYVYYGGTGVKINNGTQTAYGNTFGNGDIIGIAFDADAGKIWFAKNNTWQASGDPAAGTNAAFTSIPTGSYRPAHGIYRDASTRKATFNFGQRSFSYTPPTGFKALNTANLPEPTIKKGSKYFDTVLYTGDGGAAKSITGFGFSPDLVWIKSRSLGYAHNLGDTVRGVNNTLSSNSTGAENYAGSGDITAFNSDGFSIRETGNWGINTNTQTYVAWCWDANGAGSSNTAGSITSTVSANATAGFSIVTYTSPNNAADQTVGHGLGVKPSLIIVKNRDLTYNWDIYHASLGYNASLIFTSAGTRSGAFGAEPTSTVFTTKTGYTHNSTNTYVAYCFSEVAGYSKFGSYTGNGATSANSGPFVYLGFKPSMVIIKRTDGAGGGWAIWDNKRNTYNIVDNYLFPDTGGIEADGNGSGWWNLDFLSNGFRVQSFNESNTNASGGTYIFAAFAELSFKYSNAR